MRLKTVPLAFTLHEAARKISDTPLIIMHGLFGSKQNWRSLSKHLAAKMGRPVVAVDLRNHGESPHDSVHDFRARCMDVCELVRKQGWRNAHVLGHSMGGKVAMHLALEREVYGSDAWLKQLVVVDMAPVDQTAETAPSLFGGYVQAMNAVEEARVETPTQADAILSQTIPDLHVRQFLLTNLKRSPAGLKFRVNLDALGRELLGLWRFNPSGSPHSGPTLFIRGGDSKYIVDEMHPTIFKLFPNATIQTIDGAGHWVHADKPDAFVAIVNKFIR